MPMYEIYDVSVHAGPTSLCRGYHSRLKAFKSINRRMCVCVSIHVLRNQQILEHASMHYQSLSYVSLYKL
jgi:hypothetical protein